MVIPADWGNAKGATITSGELKVEDVNAYGWNQYSESLPFSDARNFELRFKSSSEGGATLAYLGLAESKENGFKAGLSMQETYLRRVGGGIPTTYLGRYHSTSQLAIRKENNTVSYLKDGEVLLVEPYTSSGDIVILYYGVRGNEVISLIEIVWL